MTETEEEFQEIEIEQPTILSNIYTGEDIKQKKQLSTDLEEGKQEEDNSERKDEEENNPQNRQSNDIANENQQPQNEVEHEEPIQVQEE